MHTYPAIEDHGLIGDLQTAAPVATNGTIGWSCPLRFHSPSVFASPPDHRGAGHFRVSPEGNEYVSKRLYLPGTPTLITSIIGSATEQAPSSRC